MCPVREFNRQRLPILDVFAMLDEGNEGIEADLADPYAMAVFKRVESYLAYSFAKADTVAVKYTEERFAGNEDGPLDYMSYHRSYQSRCGHAPWRILS
ncbi:hypothetical protein MKX03_016778, partial [Papaver bracteatum]